MDKIIAAMQEIVANREAQTTEVVDIPTSQHRNLIGRGGDTKKNLESMYSVNLDIPSRDSGKTAIKITGLPADVEKAKTHILDLTKLEEGETIQVPATYHHIITNNGQIFYALKRDHGVSIDHAGQKVPAKPSKAKKPAANPAPLPLISDEQDEEADTHTFHTVASAPEELDGDIPWVLRGPDAAGVAKAKAAIAAALEQAQNTTTTGYLILPDPRLYRYVIGQGGNKVNAIRQQSGCNIDVPKSGDAREAIEITGSEEGVQRARELIIKAVQDGANAAVTGRRS